MLMIYLRYIIYFPINVSFYVIHIYNIKLTKILNYFVESIDKCISVKFHIQSILDFILNTLYHQVHYVYVRKILSRLEQNTIGKI